MIGLYQKHPDAQHFGDVLLTELSEMLEYFAGTRARALGGREDAAQEVRAAILGVCRTYDLAHAQGVERRINGDVADALVGKVRRGKARQSREVLGEAEELARTEASDDRAELELSVAQRRGRVRPQDLPLLRLWSQGFTHAEIGEVLFLTPKAVERRLTKAFERLQQKK